MNCFFVRLGRLVSVALSLLVLSTARDRANLCDPFLPEHLSISCGGGETDTRNLRIDTYFEPNLGQAPANVQFLGRGKYSSYFETTGVKLVQHGRTRDSQPATAAVELRFEGAAPLKFEPGRLEPGVSAYFTGQDSNRWLPSVPHYSELIAREIYPGIDAKFFREKTNVKYDLRVRPGADGHKIRISMNGARLSVDEQGNLVAETAVGKFVQPRPFVFQRDGGAKREIAARFRLTAQTAGFEIGEYDRTKELVIDPLILSYSIPMPVFNTRMKVDNLGSVYLAGQASDGYPVKNGLNLTRGATSMVVSKISQTAAGATELAYSTYLTDGWPGGLAVDNAGSVYLTGGSSAAWPTVGSLSTTGPRGMEDVFLCKLAFNPSTSTLSLAYSTMFGGPQSDYGRAIVVDSTGAVYLTGTATRGPTQAQFPLVNPVPGGDQFYGSNFETFVSKVAFANNTFTMVYSTFIGSADAADVADIVLDQFGSVYVGGQVLKIMPPVTGRAFPVVNPIPGTQSVIQGFRDGFITKFSFNTANNQLTMPFSTLIGGSDSDSIVGLAIDASGALYFSGSALHSSTPSQNFPYVRRAPFNLVDNSQVGLVGKLTFQSATPTLVYSTPIPVFGAGPPVVDSAGAVYVPGTAGPPLTATTVLPAGRAMDQSFDAVAVKVVDTGGSAVSTPVIVKAGGPMSDEGFIAGIGPSGAIYLSGRSSGDFPTVNPIPSGPTFGDTFLIRIADTATNTLYVMKSGQGTVTSTGGVGGVNCGSTCTAEVSGTLTLTATGDPGWIFTGWSNDCSGTGQCVIEMNRSKIASATFVPGSAVSVTSAGIGTGTVVVNGATCAKNTSCPTITVPFGSTVTAVATALPGSRFFQWSGGNCAGQGTTCTFVANYETATVYAHFNLDEPEGFGQTFIPATTCRIVDTRSDSQFGRTMNAQETRIFQLALGPCQFPANITAVSLNVTVVPRGPLSYITLHPPGLPRPTVSTLNSLDGRIKANQAIVMTSSVNAAIAVYATDATDLILDVNGFFVTSSVQASSNFYTLRPCRIIDTRSPNGTFGGPFLGRLQTRDVPVPQSSCGAPSDARAYSLNITVVPKSTLGFLTVWETGRPLPTVSTLNSLNGGIVANAAIVPAGVNGSISFYASQDTELIVDINGYFGPSGTTEPLVFYPVLPCRISDTRSPNGTFGGPGYQRVQSRDYPVPSGACPIPPASRAFALNATVVPSEPFSYLTLWPAGQAMPTVSTLNALDGAITSNAAIVPAGTNNTISAFATNSTHLILDINGYFAPRPAQ